MAPRIGGDVVRRQRPLALANVGAKNGSTATTVAEAPGASDSAAGSGVPPGAPTVVTAAEQRRRTALETNSANQMALKVNGAFDGGVGQTAPLEGPAPVTQGPLFPRPRPEPPVVGEQTGVDTYDSASRAWKIAKFPSRPLYEAAALSVSTHFGRKGYDNAQSLIDHYRGGSGAPYELGADAVDQFIADQSPDEPGLHKGPANWHEEAKDDAIEEAIAAAERDPSLYGQPQNITRPWETVRAHTDQDALLSVGSFQASLTAQVVVHPPGEDGAHTVDIASQPHLYDVYDFENQGPETFQHYQNFASQKMYEGKSARLLSRVRSSRQRHRFLGSGDGARGRLKARAARRTALRAGRADPALSAVSP